MEKLISQVKQSMASYMLQQPEITFEWSDSQSEAKGILIINSLRGGACGGGARVSKTLDKQEMTELAKIMQLKFSLYGPTIGGAKAGIIMDPHDDNKYEVLKRWFQAIRPLLHDCYGTAADLNTDFSTIESILLQLDIAHPQQGIIEGLEAYRHRKQKIIERMSYLDHSIEITTGISALVSQLITGFTITEAIKHFYQLKGNDIVGKKAFVQGVGNVGASAAFYLAKAGVKVVALTDKDDAFFDDDGADHGQLANVVQSKRLSENFDQLISHQQFDKTLTEQGIDIFVPAAGPYLVNQPLISQFIANGLEIMVSGSNIPFDEQSLYGDLAEYVDQHVALIPGFVASGGMARAFYTVMKAEGDQFSEQDIFADTSAAISQLISKAIQANNCRCIAAYLYNEALKVKG